MKKDISFLRFKFQLVFSFFHSLWLATNLIIHHPEFSIFFSLSLFLIYFFVSSLKYKWFTHAEWMIKWKEWKPSLSLSFRFERFRDMALLLSEKWWRSYLQPRIFSIRGIDWLRTWSQLEPEFSLNRISGCRAT